MFVFVHYIAGVYLDFHRKDFTLGNRKKWSQIQIILVLYGVDHLDRLAGLFVFGEDLWCYFRNPDQLNNSFKSTSWCSHISHFPLIPQHVKWMTQCRKLVTLGNPGLLGIGRAPRASWLALVKWAYKEMQAAMKPKQGPGFGEACKCPLGGDRQEIRMSGEKLEHFQCHR